MIWAYNLLVKKPRGEETAAIYTFFQERSSPPSGFNRKIFFKSIFGCLFFKFAPLIHT
jgi:hypothetical protein